MRKIPRMDLINVFQVNTYYHMDWIDENVLPIQAEELRQDIIYENFVR